MGGPDNNLLLSGCRRRKRFDYHRADALRWRMIVRGPHDSYGHAFFLTFSCYKRRRILDETPLQNIVIEVLASQLGKQNGQCQGFVVMPDHVHAMVWFAEASQLSQFMKQWKQRSSVAIKRSLRDCRLGYLSKVSLDDPVWQAGYYSFNVYSQNKFKEKLDYMHANPVKAGLVEKPGDWLASSERYYGLGVEVGVPIEQPG